MSAELQFIELNERAYKYIRQFTIKNAEDALVELITNSVDAYNKNNIVNKKIDIEFENSNNSNILRVRDQAIGLTGAEMEKCFLQVGNYTTVDDSRGFFSRGAKDISAIGNITFHAIKNNLYSKVFLNSDAYGAVEVTDVVVTEEIRNQTGIIENGCLVEINLLQNFINFDPSVQAESLSKLAVLRDIMSNPNNTITYSHISHFERQLIYDFPKGTLLLDLTFQVPNYPLAQAQFVVYKTDTPIEQPRKENEMMFGFLTKDNASVYEVTTIDDRFRWNPYITSVYGYLKCPYISTLLHEYDASGSSALNPMPIIDPSRLTGVNKSHPFIESMLSIPKVRLDQILRELNNSVSQQSISISEIGDLFDELQNYGLNIIDDEEIKVAFVPNYDSELAKAIEDDRSNYVTTEKNYLITKDFNMNMTSTDEYIKEQIIRIAPTIGENSQFILDESNNLVQLVTPSDEQNELIDYLELNPSEIENIQKRPYIYELSKEGDLVKLYLFEKGRVEKVTNPEDQYVILKNKKFQISFINDLNINKRYLIEYDNGVHVKLNLHDTLIHKYLVNDRIEDGNADLSISNIKSVKSLTFLRELMIEILSDIILEHDILNNKLILDSGNFNNTRKVLDHKQKIVDRIEDPMDIIFEKFIDANISHKSGILTGIMDQIGFEVSRQIDMTTDGLQIAYLKSELDGKIIELLE
jgi:hypothetical protein